VYNVLDNVPGISYMHGLLLHLGKKEAGEEGEVGEVR
jgi:hypothetical protein